MLRVGLLGAGMVSLYHLRAWARTPGAAVVAVCDPDLERAGTRAAAFGVDRVYGEPATMLDAALLDAVDIAAPVGAHAALVRLAAGRGLHVLCQKPLCPTLAEAEALVAEVGGRVRLMVHENWRFRPYYRQVAAWLAAGRIGEPREARLAVRSSGLVERGGETPPALVRQPFFATLPRLIVFEVLVHHLDVVRWLLGPLAVTAASTRRRSARVAGEDGATIRLTGPGGLRVTVEGDLCVPDAPPLPRDDLAVVGTGGRLRFDGERLTLDGGETLRYDAEAAYQASYEGVMAHFVAGVASGAPFETEGRDNLETLRLVEAAYARAAEGRST